MFSSKSYDYIIAGAGCAGLSLLMHMLESEQFTNKRILLIDKDGKNKNDRTWCFWEQEEGLFQPIVYKEWESLYFSSHLVHKLLDIHPYTYKLIRGSDFYTYCFQRIKEANNIDWVQAEIEEVFTEEGRSGIVVEGQRVYAQYVFNSIISKPVLKSHEYWMLQHFKGWVIETEKEVFDPSSATLMDFKTSQKNGTTFFYVLPFTATKALIEYTLFSDALLPQQEYEAALEVYVKEQLGIERYTIVDREFGVIPMTNYPFKKQEGNIINIGTSGGYTKGSSGYTFQFIQKSSSAIVRNLIKGNSPLDNLPAQKRFHFYDTVLLHILHHKKMEGASIFSILFQKNRAASVLKFLDNETSLPEELKIIASLPTAVFLKAAIKQTGASL